jgi:hypothetical protein
MNKFRNMLAGGATSYWSKVPGLYNKWFTIGPNGTDAGTGMYIFKTKQDCTNYMETDLWKSMS